jgi:formylglycine-generating enzyme required for sulfatase activity
MKHRLKISTAAGLALAFVTMSSPLRADPPGPPPGAPGDTMKSLQEIWDEIQALKAQNAELQKQLSDLTSTPGSGFPMEMVAVGNPGNAPDPGNASQPDTYGAVGYDYRIGRYEVTNAQYAEFLNAVAATDPNYLYNPNMGSNARGGIVRFGASGSFSYTVKANMGDKPVNYLSWYDAVRFCNWLHNGQPTGAQGNTTTEDGAYTLTGATSIGVGSDPTHGTNGRNGGARFWLPSEDEWYKAAYHVPGVGDTYYLFPTGSDSAPTVATADGTGNINNDTANIANYDFGADWNGQNGNVTAVGSGGPGSASVFGVYDMGGNVFEYNEQIVGENRGLRGGSWNIGPSFLQSSDRSTGNPTLEDDYIGFRVAGP